MSRARFTIVLAGLFAGLLAGAVLSSAASAQTVLVGDATDPSTGAVYPIMPERALLLPGADEDFGTGDDVIDLGTQGDVDLVIRVGTVVGAAVPPPSGAAGGPALTTVTAGGGSSGQGAEVDITVLASDGTGSPPYGNVVVAADLDARPISVYAFADLDGDGVIGPTDADGAGDDPLELEEATAYVGRQVGSFTAGRFQASIGVQAAAPASMGGLAVSLVAGAYTGSDIAELFSDGPPIYTLWPFFPPLDPKRVFEGSAPAPDPDVPSELEYEVERNYLPAPGHPQLGTPFAIPVDGSSPTNDQFIVVSGAASAAGLFVEADPATHRASKRLALRPAPGQVGGRTLVRRAERLVLAADGAATTTELRLFAVDLFGNVADAPIGGFDVELTATGGVSIIAPDGNGDTSTETLSITDSTGITITVDDAGSGAGRLLVHAGATLVHVTETVTGTGADTDGDGVLDDGDGSGLAGDNTCTPDDVPFAACDDNCPLTGNADQADEDADGFGSCCDGTCQADPLRDGCDICVAGPTAPVADKTKLKGKLADAPKSEKLGLKMDFRLAVGASIDPTTESVTLSVVQNSVEAYGATLTGAFDQLGGKRSSFSYKDKDRTIAGLSKVRIKERSGGRWRASWKAAGTDLLDLDTSTVTISVTLGDDQLTKTAPCSGNTRSVGCKSD